MHAKRVEVEVQRGNLQDGGLLRKKKAFLPFTVKG